MTEIQFLSFLKGPTTERVLEEILVTIAGSPAPSGVIPYYMKADPPRNGMHKEVVEKIISLAPSRIVYVSCNPSTQARDVQLLSGHYSVEKIQPVDMFPHTRHVENVALLVRKAN